MFEIQNTGTVAAPVYASAPTTLVSFNGSNGANPYAGLIADANGDLFGTTVLRGANGTARCSRSRILARSPRQSTPAPRPRWSASTAPTAAYPYAGLTADANGNLFGTTESGGANGNGTVFEITGAS